VHTTKNDMMYSNVMSFLSVDFGVVGTFQQIINGNIEIIGKPDQCSVIRFPRSIFVPADTVLIHTEINCKFHL